jgi:hypothetical protein
MTVVEAMAYLAERGYPCSKGTVRALVNAGQLKCFRPGPTGKGPMSFTTGQLDTFLRAAETGAAPVKPTRAYPPREKKVRPVKAAVVSDAWERLRAEGGS